MSDDIARAAAAAAAPLAEALARIASAMERLAPAAIPAPDFAAADAFVWHPSGRLDPVAKVNRVEMILLHGIDRARDTLIENTDRSTGESYMKRGNLLMRWIAPLFAVALLSGCGIEPTRRAETLDIAEFEALAQALLARGTG